MLSEADRTEIESVIKEAQSETVNNFNQVLSDSALNALSGGEEEPAAGKKKSSKVSFWNKPPPPIQDLFM